jgi:hypothetical protein
MATQHPYEDMFTGQGEHVETKFILKISPKVRVGVPGCALIIDRYGGCVFQFDDSRRLREWKLFILASIQQAIQRIKDS